ncbi:MAG: 2-amino-4-hydroxy-6-hydroxymethyldihydropteridine diphosphokinase [Kangiella sp.]|nr:MAG: 2-amino-4-hydroxy-6-hydroxymethyldihydropteridine diphosphokinase [Kangiella sp.]
MVDVYIGIGSNIEPEKHFKAVYCLLKEFYPSIKFSRTFKSSAVGFVGDDFYNSVAKFSVEDDSICQLDKVLIQLKSIENQLGRARGDKKFSARVIDIDVLLFGDLVCNKPIQLPRGEIVENAYVLWPLSELAPELMHPLENKTYADLWGSFDKDSQKLTAL